MTGGVDVLPIYWLIYKLEKEAEDAGGKVTFLIGNHETMVLGNDLRYTKKKYTQLADTLGMTYPELWQKSELGHWLKTRNSIQVVGDNLFVHAGLSKEFLDRNYDIPTVNEIVSDGLFLTKKKNVMQIKAPIFLLCSLRMDRSGIGVWYVAQISIIR